MDQIKIKTNQRKSTSSPSFNPDAVFPQNKTPTVSGSGKTPTVSAGGKTPAVSTGGPENSFNFSGALNNNMAPNPLGTKSIFSFGSGSSGNTLSGEDPKKLSSKSKSVGLFNFNAPEMQEFSFGNQSADSKLSKARSQSSASTSTSTPSPFGFNNNPISQSPGTPFVFNNPEPNLANPGGGTAFAQPTFNFGGSKNSETPYKDYKSDDSTSFVKPSNKTIDIKFGSKEN